MVWVRERMGRTTILRRAIELNFKGIKIGG
jgi:hypothetical protein